MKNNAKYKCFSRFSQLIRAQAAIKNIADIIRCSVLMVVSQGSVYALPVTIEGTVTRVIDGDTIWVKAASGSKPLKVRVQAIDAPEVCQAGGVAAKNALATLVLGKAVTLTTRATDNYNRTVASIQLQGQDVGRSLVRSGHAWATGPFQSAGPYATDQQTAQIERRGIFASGKPQHPREFRKHNGSCFKQR